MPLAPAKVIGDQQALARQLLDVCLSVKSGERVWINSWDHTLGLASQPAWECRKRGCEILTTIQQEDLWLRSIIEAPFESFDRLPKHMVAALRRLMSTSTLWDPADQSLGKRFRKSVASLSPAGS